MQEKFEGALVAAMQEVFPMFGFMPEHVSSKQQKYLTSGCEVNVLTSFARGLRGHIVFGCEESMALRIVSTMMGMDVGNLDAMSKSALGELNNMLVGTIFRKMAAENPVEISAPTIATGKEMFIMVSKVKTNTTSFNIGGNRLDISFCIE